MQDQKMKPKNALTRRQKRNLLRILLAGGLLIALEVLCLTQVLPDVWYWRLPFFLIPYLIVGVDVLRKSVLGIAHGQLLDENFLMSIATIGALAIGEYPEAVFVMLFYQLGEWFQSIAVGRSRNSIAALMDLCPETARVERDGKEQEIYPGEVAVGEILIVRPGEKIPLDGVVLEGISALNTASLTGESLPRDVSPGDAVVSGCVNGEGLLRIRATKPFADSTVSKILELVENSTAAKSRAEGMVTKFARVYTPVVVCLAALIALVPAIIHWVSPASLPNPLGLVKTALIFLVVSCPCALVISVPLSYFAGIGGASKRGILIKGANDLEALARTDTIAFDKTGTLTEGKFHVTEVCPVGMSAERLLALAGAAEGHSNHPIARSLVEAAPENQPVLIEQLEEIPGRGVCALADGQKLLVGNASLLREAGISIPSLPETAGTMIFLALNGSFCGWIVISDTCKSGAAEAIQNLRALGVRRAVMLSGDREPAAKAVASELGIPEVCAGLLPGDKVAAAERLLAEKQGTFVYVGDGMNDAPVLARADVGIAMGAFGSDAAIEAADVVLMDDSLSRLPLLLRMARKTRRIVLQNIVFAISVKVAFLALNIFFPNLWLATFADVGVAVLAILNASRAGR